MVPFDGTRFLLIEDVNGLVIDEKFPIFRLNRAFEATMNRVEVEQISLEKGWVPWEAR